MVDSIKQGFQGALSDALTRGMQGGLNSPLDFMNSIKGTISSALSSQLASVLLNNTGLQDVMNKLTASLTKASTSGDPNDIVNMFKNNDFGKQMNDALAPFLPLIQQIVGSTNGIFTVLKDQTFNSPTGFKIDNYMNEIASRIGYQGIKTMNPNVNDVGSPMVNTPSGTGSSTPITVTPPSQTPTGIPTSTSGKGATSTGAPAGTTGEGIGTPGSFSDTKTKVGIAKVTAQDYAGLYQRPMYFSGYFIKKLPQGSEWKAYYEHDGWINLGSGWVNKKNVQVMGDIPKYHTGGIAGITNFASAQGLKPNELHAILQKGETTFQPKQLDDLVNGAMRVGANASSGGEINLSVTINIEGGGNYDQSRIEAVVETAVAKAMAQFKKTTKMNNLTWKGTSY